MDKIVFEPDKKWLNILLARRIVILACLGLITIVLGIFWPITLICTGIFDALTIWELMIFLSKKERIEIDKDGKVKVDVVNRLKQIHVQCLCSEIVAIDVQNSFFRLYIDLKTTKNQIINLSNHLFTNEELREFVQIIQKNGGLSSFNIDF